MAKNMQPIAKRCKALGISPAVMGYAKKTTNRNPGSQMKRKKSEYGIQLAEKQKAKYTYGVLERQFHNMFNAAAKADGITGEVLLQNLESRLDNVVFRLGIAPTRAAARQLVNHKHIVVNGNVVAVNTKNCVIEGADKLIATVGLRDVVVVDTKDATLITTKENAGEIKQVLAKLRESGRNEYL